MNLFVFETQAGTRAYWRGPEATLEEARAAIQRELDGSATVVFVERIK